MSMSHLLDAAAAAAGTYQKYVGRLVEGTVFLLPMLV